MKFLPKKILFPFLLCFVTVAHAQRFGRFGNVANISYEKIKTLYGTVPTTRIESQEMNDTINYFVYVWVSDTVQEAGLRFISPVPPFASPNKGDMLTEDYPDTLTKTYFDPLLILEYSLDATSARDAFCKKKTMDWLELSRNDNAPGLFAQPSGINSNSLIRIQTDTKKEFFLKPGLYRIRFRASAQKKPEGTFLLQVGLSPHINQFLLFRTEEELH